MFGPLKCTLPPVVLVLLVLGAARGDLATADEPIGAETVGADHGTTGAITGIVTYQGDVPRARVADDAGQRRPLLQVDRKSHGLRYAIAYLEINTRSRGAEAAPSPAQGGNETPPAKPVIVDQLEHTFVPHLIAVRSGQTVIFTNSDTANHNVRANSLDARNEFNVFTGAGGEYRKVFHADRNRPVRLGCDIHPWMQAWVYAFDHPYYAVTDQRGRFRIAGVPPGTHELVVRQPDGGLSQKTPVVVEAGQMRHVATEFSRADVKGL